MNIVAVVSLKGGVGKTTTVANLGAALAQEDPSGVVVIDLDARNQLALHVGLGDDVAGLSQASLRDVGWGRAVQRGIDGLGCLPFGRLTDRPASPIDALAAGRPDLLGNGLKALSDHRLAILDTPPHPSPLFDQALALADVVLVVLLPDAASFATLPALQALLRERRLPWPSDDRAGVHVLLNGLDGTRLSRDVRAVISAQSQLPMLPFVIHRDQAVPEALALQRTVVADAPSSQAAQDFRRAADWLTGELAEVSGIESTLPRPDPAADQSPATSTG